MMKFTDLTEMLRYHFVAGAYETDGISWVKVKHGNVATVKQLLKLNGIRGVSVSRMEKR